LKLELKGFESQYHTVVPSLLPKSGNVLEQRVILVKKPKIEPPSDASPPPTMAADNLPAVVKEHAKAMTKKTHTKAAGKNKAAAKTLKTPEAANPGQKPGAGAGSSGQEEVKRTKKTTRRGAKKATGKKRIKKRRKRKPKAKPKSTEFENPF